MTDTPKPTEISLHQKSRVLEISYADGERFELSYEFLRVHSPSAEVQGHGPGQGVLQVGKEDVMILNIEPVGSYAIQPAFDDGHDTGIYSWDTIYDMGKNKDKYWQEYLQKLATAGHKRRITASCIYPAVTCRSVLADHFEPPAGGNRLNYCRMVNTQAAPRPT